jgi:tetratricopeptide (TPR) repeat protein
MWRSLKKYYKVILLSVAVVAIVIFVFNWYSQKQELNNLFGLKETIDYSSVETAVVEKINQLWIETKENTESTEHWGKLGMNLYIHGYKIQSVPVFKKASSLNEKDFRWVYFCAIALDDIYSEEADYWFELGRPLKPNFPPLCIKLGNRYLVAGEIDKATELYNEAITSWINVPHAHVGLAKIAIATNELDTAQVHLHKALDIAPSYREAHVLLADIYRRRGEKSIAEEAFRKIERLPKKLDLKDPLFDQMVNEGVSSFWHQVRGDNYLNSGRLEKAVVEFKRVIEIKPHSSFYNNLGNVYQKQKKYNLALEQYQLALQMDSLNTDALNNMGVVYYKTGDIIMAISFVMQALEIDAEFKDGYLNLGTFYKQLNQRSKSIQTFKNGMTLAPNDLRFSYQLSWLLSTAPEAHLRNGKEALRLAKYVCDETNYTTPSTLDLLSAAFAESGQFDKARENVTKAYELALKSGNRQLATDIYGRFKLYEKNQPFREANF